MCSCTAAVLVDSSRRRRACWHLLRCVWSTASRFRVAEDAANATASRQESGKNGSSEGRLGAAHEALDPAAHRCLFAVVDLLDFVAFVAVYGF